MRIAMILPIFFAVLLDIAIADASCASTEVPRNAKYGGASNQENVDEITLLQVKQRVVRKRSASSQDPEGDSEEAVEEFQKSMAKNFQDIVDEEIQQAVDEDTTSEREGSHDPEGSTDEERRKYENGIAKNFKDMVADEVAEAEAEGIRGFLLQEKHHLVSKSPAVPGAPDADTAEAHTQFKRGLAQRFRNMVAEEIEAVRDGTKGQQKDFNTPAGSMHKQHDRFEKIKANKVEDVITNEIAEAVTMNTVRALLQLKQHISQRRTVASQDPAGDTDDARAQFEREMAKNFQDIVRKEIQEAVDAGTDAGEDHDPEGNTAAERREFENGIAKNFKDIVADEVAEAEAEGIRGSLLQIEMQHSANERSAVLEPPEGDTHEDQAEFENGMAKNFKDIVAGEVADAADEGTHQKQDSFHDPEGNTPEERVDFEKAIAKNFQDIVADEVAEAVAEDTH